MTPEGFYNGTVLSSYLEKDSKDVWRLCFELKLDGDYIETARHPIEGEYGDISRKILESLDLEWPEGLQQLDTAADKVVRVKVKHKDGRNGNVFCNAYVVVGRGAGGGTAAADDDVSALVRKLKLGDDDDKPF